MTAPADPALDLVGNWVRVLSLRTRLLAWYEGHRRDLPWRRRTDAYAVLVSEMMLQQTRVETVTPYFARWMERWPGFEALAAAREDEVLAAWSGLGYYRRARALHAIARRVVAELDGELPREPAALRDLPGVGPYTAAAVASIAYGLPAAVVDGNVERVLCRLLGLTAPKGAARDRVVAEAARRLVTGFSEDDPDAPRPEEGLRAADWNQAMMELGSLVCAPREPLCVACPWTRSCLAHREGVAAALPKRRAKRAPVDVTLHSAVVWRGDAFLLVRRGEGALLGGLWELPTTAEGEPGAALGPRLAESLGLTVPVPDVPARTFRHAIARRRITVRVYEVRVEHAPLVRDTAAWVRPADLADYGVSSMTRKALAGRPSADS